MGERSGTSCKLGRYDGQDEMNIGWTEFANAEPIEDIMNHDFGDEGTGRFEDLDDFEE